MSGKGFNIIMLNMFKEIKEEIEIFAKKQEVTNLNKSTWEKITK